MSNMSKRFSETIASIKKEYEALEYDLGWRFLYSPTATLSPDTRIMFLGLNPGGGVFEAPIAGVEDGNAYRVETWPRNGPRLQAEVQALFQALANELDAPGDWRRIMDNTLTSNFCPFRSRSWDALPSKDPAIRFSENRWTPLLQGLSPMLVICNGSGVLDAFEPVLLSSRYRKVSEGRHATGWGNITARIETYSHPTKHSLTAIQLPHLSRFTVVTSQRCRSSMSTIIRAMAQAIRPSVDETPGIHVPESTGDTEDLNHAATRRSKTVAPPRPRMGHVSPIFIRVFDDLGIQYKLKRTGTIDNDNVLRYQGSSVQAYFNEATDADGTYFAIKRAAYQSFGWRDWEDAPCSHCAKEKKAGDFVKMPVPGREKQALQALIDHWLAR
jgi:hypothetical protein